MVIAAAIFLVRLITGLPLIGSLDAILFIVIALAGWLLMRGRHPLTLLLCVLGVVLGFLIGGSGLYYRLGLDAVVNNLPGWRADSSARFLFLTIVPVAICAWIAVPIDKAMRRRTERTPINSVAGRPVIVGYTADGQAVYAPVHGGVASQRTNSMAIVALVLGVAGGVLAIPFGHIALTQIKGTGEQGRGMAIAGLILGYLSLAVVVAAIIFVIAAANGAV